LRIEKHGDIHRLASFGRFWITIIREHSLAIERIGQASAGQRRKGSFTVVTTGGEPSIALPLTCGNDK
jgi:hypothetical protein